jgi:hypothetical protein
VARRNDLVAELHNAKEALLASERRGKKATKRLRDIEKALEPIVHRMDVWATSHLADTDNAPRLMTVGECRRLLSILRDDNDNAVPGTTDSEP